MPIPTSSMYQNRNARRQRVRQLWAAFEQWVQSPRRDMVRTRDEALREADRKWRNAAQPLSITTNTANRITARLTQKEHEASKEKLKKSIEQRHYLSMREEWEKRLHAAGLQVEDWDDMTAQDQLAVTRALGDFDMGEDEDEKGADEADEEEGGDESFPKPPPGFVAIAAQPLSQSVSHQSQSSQSSHSSSQSYYPAPSLASSRSYNTSSASYAFVDPKQFTDDERDEASLLYHGYKQSGYAPGSEDEDMGISIPNYKSWTRDRQQRPSGHTTAWSSSNQSSLSSSPAAEPLVPHHQHQPSSSLSSHFPPRIPSTLSTSTSTSANPNTSTKTSSASTAAALSSSPASAAIPVPPKSKSKLNAAYIGPYLTTPDSSSEAEADADFEDMSEADQAEAFENFKMGTRIQKIREFHEEAAQLDVELATVIWNNRRAAGLPTSISSMNLNGFGHGHGYDKASEAQIISEHENKMRELRERKEKERKAVVALERKRRRDEIKKRRATVRATDTTTTTKGPKSVNKPGQTMSSSAYSSSASKTSAIPVNNKPKTPVVSSGAGVAPSIEEWQTVLETAPSLNVDTAWQISQLLSQEGGTHHEEPEYDTQEWNTPQFRNAKGASGANDSRKRTDSISVLDDSRFGTISAKSLGQRRGTISASAANGIFGTANTNAANGSRTQQQQLRQTSLSDEVQTATDRFAGAFDVNSTKQEDEEQWEGWGPKPTSNMNGAGKVASAWAAKKTSATGPPSPAISSMWGAGVKKTFGFGGSNNSASEAGNVGSDGGWGEEWDNGMHAEEGEEEEEEEEGETSRPSIFGSAAGTSPAQKKTSLLSGMMMRGKNAVAGAVNAAMSPITMTPVTPTPTAVANGLLKKSTTSSAPVATAAVPVNTTTATSAAKKAAKKQRQTMNKKGTLGSFLKDDEMEENQEPEQQQQVTPTTPRPAAAPTKFSSALGATRGDKGLPSAFGFGSSPTSRSAAVGGGGMWEDMVSTTPRPGGLSSIFGSNGDLGGLGVTNGVKKPSGLHREVWSAEGDEQDEQEESGGGNEEMGWMPGSLNPRGVTKSKLGPGPDTSARKTAGASAWGWGSTVSSSPATSTAAAPPTKATNLKKGLLLGKRGVVVEEVPDEADGPWNRNPSDVLASDSRVILEPKPSKPAEMYEGIFAFGTAGSSPEQERNGAGRGKPGARGVGVGTGSGEGEGFYDEEWFRKAAMQLKKGTEDGERMFGATAPAGSGNTGVGNMSGSTSVGVNIPGRGNGSSGNMANGGSKFNNHWGTTPSSFSSNMPGSMAMSGSFKDSSPLANGPPPKIGTSASKSSMNQAWGMGLSSSPKVGVGVAGIGKNTSTKAKATTETSTRFGMNAGFGWGTPPSSAGVHDSLEYGWNEEAAEEHEEVDEVMQSKMRLQELFGSAPGPANVKAGAGVVGISQAKAQKEQEERERREAEEQAAREKEAKEAQEKEAKERELAAKAAASAKPKKNKGKRR